MIAAMIPNGLVPPLDAWLAAGAAALVAMLLVRVLDPLARRAGVLDHPTHDRKLHLLPVPVTGGIAILLAACVVTRFAMPGQQAMTGFVLGAVLLTVVGVLDDLHDLPWYVRVGMQALAALLMVYVGGVKVEQLGELVGVHDTGLGFLSIPFTVFATVGLINAVNMIDGIDGLAGSLVLVALLMLCAACRYAGDPQLAERALILGGAVAGFLAMNMRMPWRPRAKVFLGNSGSAVLGFALAWFSFRLTQNPGHPVSPVLALWLVPVPVVDTLVLMGVRFLEGRSPFFADRNHIHHLMQDAGLGPTRISLVLASFSLACGFLVAQAMRIDVPNMLLLALYFGLCAAWYLLTRKRGRALAFFAALANRRRAQGAPDVE